ncbi:MAG: sugar phosphate isomerase/epimerase family protein [Candidatus Hydrothermarchaeota archaeon]|nr:sugar phosphate isomerase/epimerase family protein [Candidatus Hydrothermarchaeota archaeon]
MLGCAEFCLPGKNLKERLEAARKHNLWVELVNNGKRDLSILSSFDTEIKSVQAYLLHDLSLLSKNAAIRKAALRHVKDTIEIAGKIEAGNVLTVPTYGFEYVAWPYKKCIEIFRELSNFALDFDVRILIEALSRKRTSLLPSLAETRGLVKAINRKNVCLMADTCHIYDSGENVAKMLKKFSSEIVELHLRDSESLPPGKGKLNFKKILRICKNSLLCLEYKSGSEKDLEDSLKYLKN